MNALSPRGLIDVTDLLILEHATVEQLVRDHRALWGAPPEGIVLPIFQQRGPAFLNDLGVEPVPVRYGNQELLLPELARICLTHGLKLYLSVEPSLAFVEGDMLHVVDIVMDSAAHACIGKPESQMLLSMFISNALREVNDACGKTPKLPQAGQAVEGVAIDIVNLFPMSATKEQLELTCFCPSCVHWLQGQDGVNVARFQVFPNAWNLGLRDTGTGIGYIDEIQRNTSGVELLALSALKGFGQELRAGRTDAQMRAYATELLAYLKARSEQVLDAIRNIFAADGVGNAVSRRIVITEGVPYGWTAGAFLADLDDPDVCDEVWFDPTASQGQMSKVDFRSYLWRRSRYHLDAFAQIVSQARDTRALATTGLGRQGRVQVRRIVDLRRLQVMGRALTSRITLLTLPKADKRVGFVAPALSEELSKRLVDFEVAQGVGDLESPG